MSRLKGFLTVILAGRGWVQRTQLSECALRHIKLQLRRQSPSSIYGLKEFLKPEPGLVGAIPEKCEVASLVIVVTGQLHLPPFHTEKQAATASLCSCSVTCKVQVWKWKPGRKVTWSKRASTF